MIGIKVCRDSSFPGECRSSDSNLNWGSDISDVLLTTEEAALERGRVEIDTAYSNRINSGIIIASPVFIYPGSLVGIDEGGEINNGMLNSISLSLSKDANGETFSASSLLSIERNL